MRVPDSRAFGMLLTGASIVKPSTQKRRSNVPDSQSPAKASEAVGRLLACHVTTPAPFDRPQQYDANQRRVSGNRRPEGKDERAQGSGPIGVRYRLPARGEDQPTPVCANQRAHYGVGISERTRRGGFPINGMNRYDLRIRERRHANAAC